VLAVNKIDLVNYSQSIARLVERRLAADGYRTYTLDGDNLRHGLNRCLEGSLYQSPGVLRNFTGITSGYEAPENPEPVVRTMEAPPEQIAEAVVSYLRKNRYLELG